MQGQGGRKCFVILFRYFFSSNVFSAYVPKPRRENVKNLEEGPRKLSSLEMFGFKRSVRKEEGVQDAIVNDLKRQT
jgi:hypothetical protein